MAIETAAAGGRKEIKMVMGLGNPDEAYAGTYHNIGLMAIRALAGDVTWKKREKFRYFKADGFLSRSLRYRFGKANRSELRLRGSGLIFVVPAVYMNESGEAARAALAYFKLAPDALAVIHDDSDLPLGEFKVQFARGAGGHKGVASVIDHLKGNGFWRVRIGIRPQNEPKRKKAGDFVLKKIKAAEKEKFAAVFAAIGQELES